jgi:hypothetical protein
MNAKNVMTAAIRAAKGKCPFCPAKGEKAVFSVNAEGFLNSLICGEHLWNFLQAKEEAPAESPPNGQPLPAVAG